MYDIRSSRLPAFVVAAGLGVVAWVAAGCAQGESAENEGVADRTEPVEMSSPEPEDAFARLDANADESLDIGEWDPWFDEAGIWARWDVDRDSLVTREEVLSHSFGLWDRNGDERVDESEWKRATELWFPDGEELVVLGDADHDGDSELDADEFREAIDLSILGEAWIESLDEQVFKNAYFELYDLNDDGRVDRLEWDAALDFYGVPES